jgi:hypothetical protein
VRRQKGQALTETMVMMLFLTLIIFGFVHLCMMAATKSMVSYAAFAAARTTMVRGWQPPSLNLPLVGEYSYEFDDWWKVQTGWPAAWQVLDNIRWWRSSTRNRPDFPIGVAEVNDRRGLTVTYRVPFGVPIFNNVPSGGLAITAFSPYVIQANIGECGDNAQASFGECD